MGGIDVAGTDVVDMCRPVAGGTVPDGSGAALPSRAEWKQVCRLAEIADRAILPFRMDGQHLVLVRDGDELFACERACPHEQADLAKGHCSGRKLFCPRHFAWFDLVDGRMSPGWDVRPIRMHAVRVEADRVLVALRQP